MKTMTIRVTDQMRERIDKRAEMFSEQYGSAAIKFTASEVVRVAIEFYLGSVEKPKDAPRNVTSI